MWRRNTSRLIFWIIKCRHHHVKYAKRKCIITTTKTWTQKHNKKIRKFHRDNEAIFCLLMMINLVRIFAQNSRFILYNKKSTETQRKKESHNDTFCRCGCTTLFSLEAVVSSINTLYISFYLCSFHNSLVYYSIIHIHICALKKPDLVKCFSNCKHFFCSLATTLIITIIIYPYEWVLWCRQN